MTPVADVFARRLDGSHHVPHATRAILRRNASQLRRRERRGLGRPIIGAWRLLRAGKLY